MGGNGITAYGRKGGFSFRAIDKELFIGFDAFMDIHVIGGCVAEILKIVVVVVYSSSQKPLIRNNKDLGTCVCSVK